MAACARLRVKTHTHTHSLAVFLFVNDGVRKEEYFKDGKRDEISDISQSKETKQDQCALASLSVKPKITSQGPNILTKTC